MHQSIRFFRLLIVQITPPDIALVNSAVLFPLRLKAEGELIRVGSAVVGGGCNRQAFVVTCLSQHQHGTYVLAVAVSANDVRQASWTTRTADVSTVWENRYTLLHPDAPFGRFKMSGTGRELGTHDPEAYLEVKAVHHNQSTTMWVFWEGWNMVNVAEG